jgi:hypothetical protein
MRFITALGLAVLGLLWSQAQADDSKQEDKAGAARLVGTYQIVSGEQGGQKIAADRLKDVTVQIATNAITMFDKDKKVRRVEGTVPRPPSPGRPADALRNP